MNLLIQSRLFYRREVESFIRMKVEQAWYFRHACSDMLNSCRHIPVGTGRHLWGIRLAPKWIDHRTGQHHTMIRSRMCMPRRSILGCHDPERPVRTCGHVTSYGSHFHKGCHLLKLDRVCWNDNAAYGILRCVLGHRVIDDENQQCRNHLGQQFHISLFVVRFEK